MITKKFGIDFYSEGGALTLAPCEVAGDNVVYGVTLQRTHPDGWTIEGKITENCFDWVNEFEASHPTYGRVWGDFEIVVYADSEEGFTHFYTNHTPEAWDYQHI